jgi:hypothetical protein
LRDDGAVAANARLTRRARQDFQPAFLSNLNDARDVLLLLRSQRRDFHEEALEARWRDDAHEANEHRDAQDVD